MQIALDIGQLVSAAALVATLGVVIWYTIKTAEMANATRNMARVSQQQRFDQQRPLLVPEGTPAFQDDNPNWLDWQTSQQQITFRNVGSGVALNVVSVLYGCESYVIGEIGQEKRVYDSRANHWTCWLGSPVAAGDSVAAVHQIGASTFYSGRDHIGRHNLNAPPQPTMGELMSGQASMRLARISITCWDVFGRKHASIFDYVQHMGGWRLVEFMPDIAEDLHDLEGKA